MPPPGLSALCPHDDKPILAIPGRERGQVQVVDLASPTKAPAIVAAHETALAHIALNRVGVSWCAYRLSSSGLTYAMVRTGRGSQLHQKRARWFVSSTRKQGKSSTKCDVGPSAHMLTGRWRCLTRSGPTWAHPSTEHSMWWHCSISFNDDSSLLCVSR